MGQVNELKDFTRGQLDAALMKIGQDAEMGTADGINAFLANKLVVSKPVVAGDRVEEVADYRLLAQHVTPDGKITLENFRKCLVLKWREQDGVIYFSVTSDGKTGEEWIKHLEDKGFRIGDYAKSMLRSKDFKPTKGVTYEIAVLKGTLFEDNDRITSKIRAEADKRKLTKPNAEVACLIREMFSDKELEAMGLWWIVAMHEPIKDSDGDPRLLLADRSDDGRRLFACYGSPGHGWSRGNGFAFVVSQVGPQN